MVWSNRYLFACVALISLVGCGKFDANGAGDAIGSQSTKPVIPFGTCDRKDVLSFNVCVESVGVEYNDAAYLDILQNSCLSTGGIYSTNNCDRATSLGTCVVGSGLSNETHVTYYAPEYDAASAASACVAIPAGVWTASGN